MQPFTEVFVSELIDKLVIDKVGNRVGRVGDVLIKPEAGFPKVCGVEVKRRRETVVVSDDHVAMLNKQIVSLNIVREDVSHGDLTGDELYLCRDLLDRQIVDTDGARVVRVNDLKITQVNDGFRLVAVDIGFRGLVRRLGAERALRRVAGMLGRSLPEKLISWGNVDLITPDLSAIKLSVSQGKLAALHPYDIAQIVGDLGTQERSAIFQTLDNERAAETLVEMETEMQASILEGMSKDRAADILEMMASDDAADVLNELPDDTAAELLELMEREEAAEVEELREYEEREAGSLMTTEYIALPEGLTADETINELRRLAPEAETIYYIYVVDAEEHLAGVLSLRELIIAKPETRLADIMRTRIITVGDEAPTEDAISIIRKYDLLAVPVTDGDNKLVGIITVDDVIDAVIPPRKRNVLNFS
ncbi:magnesium transporter [Anaeroselena agilis]|uniref:CBS domain-containing protein n=1 Tax=Anaeroselena agilis TaxID=3063788 RepID=A0ABU3NYS6_9FIRM|nr:CBS domain-containing protein [Selenomonadales bacterium 4137-cl]